MRAVTVLVISATLLLHAATSAIAAAVDDNPGAEREFTSLIAQERSSRGLGALSDDPELIEVARRHAARMAAEKNLHHNPNLKSEVADWEVLGENVGRGSNVAEVHAAFMESETHRAQILEPRYTEVGVGAVWADGEVWVAEVFRKRQPPAPAPPPPPADDGANADAQVQAASTPAPAPPASAASAAAVAPAPAALAEGGPALPPAAPASQSPAEAAVAVASASNVAGALVDPAGDDGDFRRFVASPIAAGVPLTEGVPLVVEVAAGLLLLIVGTQTMTLRRLGLV
ncbi:MAG: CAP domain-containing protein [Acidimicrobiia bacterium]